MHSETSYYSLNAIHAGNCFHYNYISLISELKTNNTLHMWMKRRNAGKGKVLTLRSAVYHKKAIEFAMRVRIHVCDNTKLATSNAYCIV